MKQGSANARGRASWVKTMYSLKPYFTSMRVLDRDIVLRNDKLLICWIQDRVLESLSKNRFRRAVFVNYRTNVVTSTDKYELIDIAMDKIKEQADERYYLARPKVFCLVKFQKVIA